MVAIRPIIPAAMLVFNAIVGEARPRMPLQDLRAGVHAEMDESGCIQQYAPVRTTGESLSPLLSDLESHMANPDHPFKTDEGCELYDPITRAHETTHGINNEIWRSLGGLDNGKRTFYLCEDQMAILEEPHLSLQTVALYIPVPFREEGIFGDYIRDNWMRATSPLYIFDEWVAYANGTAVGIEQARIGALEAKRLRSELGIMRLFDAYAISVGMAAKKEDREYWNSDAGNAMQEFLTTHLARTQQLFTEGLEVLAVNGVPTPTTPQFPEQVHRADRKFLQFSASVGRTWDSPQRYGR